MEENSQRNGEYGSQSRRRNSYNMVFQTSLWLLQLRFVILFSRLLYNSLFCFIPFTSRRCWWHLFRVLALSVRKQRTLLWVNIGNSYRQCRVGRLGVGGKVCWGSSIAGYNTIPLPWVIPGKEGAEGWLRHGGLFVSGASFPEEPMGGIVKVPELNKTIV